MVSGDHYDTAVKVAKDAGIILVDDETTIKNLVMTGEDFRKAVGPRKQVRNDLGELEY